MKSKNEFTASSLQYGMFDLFFKTHEPISVFRPSNNGNHAFKIEVMPNGSKQTSSFLFQLFFDYRIRDQQLVLHKQIERFSNCGIHGFFYFVVAQTAFGGNVWYVFKILTNFEEFQNSSYFCSYFCSYDDKFHKGGCFSFVFAQNLIWKMGRNTLRNLFALMGPKKKVNTKCLFSASCGKFQFPSLVELL